MTSKLLAFFLITGAAFGQAVCVTNQNNVGMPLGPLQHPAIGLERGTELRHNNYAFDGSGPIDLGASFVRYEIVSGPTMSISKTNVTYSATVIGPGLTQVIITPSIPAGVYYTKFLQYQANNSNYLRMLSWDTLVVTNPPTAGGGSLGNLTVQWEIQGDGDLAPDGTDRTIVPHTDGGADLGRTDERFREVHAITARVGRLFVAGDADVGGTLSALDNSRVLRVGETNTVDLTNTSVQVRSPTNATEVATKEYVDAIAGGDAIIGSLQIYTGLHGVAYFTNALGYPEPLRDKSLPSTKWTTFYDFDGPEEIAAWSNLNVTGSAWTYTVTNGYLSIVGPNESASGRFFGLIPATTGVASRFAMRILQPLQYSVWANGNYGYGCSAYDVGLTNTVFHGRRANTLGDVLETYIFNRSFSEGQDTRYVAPYTAGSLSTAYTYLWGYCDYIMYGDFDGVSTLRFYTANHGGERPALQYRATNCASVQAWAIFAQCSSAVASGTNSSAFIIDWYGVLQSNLWTSAF